MLCYVILYYFMLCYIILYYIILLLYYIIIYRNITRKLIFDLVFLFGILLLIKCIITKSFCKFEQNSYCSIFQHNI